MNVKNLRDFLDGLPDDLPVRTELLDGSEVTVTGAWALNEKVVLAHTRSPRKDRTHI